MKRKNTRVESTNTKTDFRDTPSLLNLLRECVDRLEMLYLENMGLLKEVSTLTAENKRLRIELINMSQDRE